MAAGVLIRRLVHELVVPLEYDQAKVAVEQSGALHGHERDLALAVVIWEERDRALAEKGGALIGDDLDEARRVDRGGRAVQVDVVRLEQIAVVVGRSPCPVMPPECVSSRLQRKCAAWGSSPRSAQIRSASRRSRPS